MSENPYLPVTPLTLSATNPIHQSHYAQHPPNHHHHPQLPSLLGCQGSLGPWLPFAMGAPCPTWWQWCRSFGGSTLWENQKGHYHTRGTSLLTDKILCQVFFPLPAIQKDVHGGVGFGMKSSGFIPGRAKQVIWFRSTNVNMAQGLCHHDGGRMKERKHLLHGCAYGLIQMAIHLHSQLSSYQALVHTLVIQYSINIHIHHILTSTHYSDQIEISMHI